MKGIIRIFKVAKEKGLKNVSIRIQDNQYGGVECVLYVGSKGRMTGSTLKVLRKSLSDHGNLSWMNEETKNVKFLIKKVESITHPETIGIYGSDFKISLDSSVDTDVLLISEDNVVKIYVVEFIKEEYLEDSKEKIYWYIVRLFTNDASDYLPENYKEGTILIQKVK